MTRLNQPLDPPIAQCSQVYSSVRVYVGSEQVAFDLVADTGSDNCLLVNLAGKRVRQDREAKREGKWSMKIMKDKGVNSLWRI